MNTLRIFQMFKLELSAFTKKTIHNSRHFLKNSPKKGVLALKVPKGRDPEFCQGLPQCFYIWYNCLHILTEFQKNNGCTE